jgi:DNA-directed RNA polymerase specialized sigma24 family protein
MESAIDLSAAWHDLGERLRAYVARRVSPADADDLVQSVMVKLLGHPGDRTIGALSDCLEPMLDMLSAADAGVLRRIDLHGEAQTTLAASLGIPLSTLKSRVQRARTRLRAAFDSCCTIELSRKGAPVAFERGAACAPECRPGEFDPGNSR